MNTSDLIERAKSATYELAGKTVPARGSYVTLPDGRRVGVSLDSAQGRTRKMAYHLRANFHINGKRVTREVADAALAEYRP